MFLGYVPFSEGGSQNPKFSLFQIFSQIRSEGGGPQISNFSQIQKSPKYPRGGGGGQENLGLFPLFAWDKKELCTDKTIRTSRGL